MHEFLDVVLIAQGQKSCFCRRLDSGEEVTLRIAGLKDVIPAEIVRVALSRSWRRGGRTFVEGEIQSVRLDVPALYLTPLKLHEFGLWEPAEEYWGEEGEPIEDWAKPIIARGPRPMYEMEQGCGNDDASTLESDPIGIAVDLHEGGDRRGAWRQLMSLLELDLRCLDAHAHLGNMAFEMSPKRALRHYQVGVRIGELSLGADFKGVLPWGLLDNRPFLRCLHGFGLCLWRLDRIAEAKAVFERMLWLNPSDNQGARFLLADVNRGLEWSDAQYSLQYQDHL